MLPLLIQRPGALVPRARKLKGKQVPSPSLRGKPLVVPLCARSKARLSGRMSIVVSIGNEIALVRVVMIAPFPIEPSKVSKRKWVTYANED